MSLSRVDLSVVRNYSRGNIIMPRDTANRLRTQGTPPRRSAAQFALIAAKFKGGNYDHGGLYDISHSGWLQMLNGDVVLSPDDRQEFARLLTDWVASRAGLKSR